MLIEQAPTFRHTTARSGRVYVALSSIVSPENEKALATDRQQNQAEGPVPFRAGVPLPLPGSGWLFGHAVAKHRRPRRYCQQPQRIKAAGHHRSGHQGNLPQNRFLSQWADWIARRQFPAERPHHPRSQAFARRTDMQRGDRTDAPNPDTDQG